MYTRKNAPVFRIGLAIAWVSLSMVWGCSGILPTGSDNDSIRVAERRLGPGDARAKDAGEMVFTESQTIRGKDGGVIWISDGRIGTTILYIPPRAFVGTETITMRISAAGTVAVELGPDGLQFAKPARLWLSYYGADLEDTKPHKIVMLYDNVALGEWQIVPGSTTNPAKSTVSAPLWHFSRYAVGSVE